MTLVKAVRTINRLLEKSVLPAQNALLPVLTLQQKAPEAALYPEGIETIVQSRELLRFSYYKSVKKQLFHHTLKRSYREKNNKNELKIIRREALTIFAKNIATL